MSVLPKIPPMVTAVTDTLRVPGLGWADLPSFQSRHLHPGVFLLEHSVL